MKIFLDLLIVITTWLIGIILLLKIIVTILGALAIIYQIRNQVVECGGWKPYLNKIFKWRN